MSAALDGLRIQGTTSLKIGSIPVMAQYGIAALVTAFKKANPMIRMSVDEREACDLLAALDSGEYEMTFYRGDHLRESRQYQVHSVFEDRLAALLPSSHPLAGRASLSLSELSGEDFLLLDKRTDLYGLCIKACKKAGFAPNVVYSGTRIDNLVTALDNPLNGSAIHHPPEKWT